MDINTTNSNLFQDELIIRILEFVCNNKDKKIITAALVKRDLFPEFDIDQILLLFDTIEKRNIVQLNVVKGNHYYLRHRLGLENYVQTLKQMKKKDKLHRLLEYLSIESKQLRKSFDSGELVHAFTPPLDIHEVNALCRILIDNKDVVDSTTKDASSKGMVTVTVINATHDAYHIRKYLEDDEQSQPTQQSYFKADNLILGNNYGEINQNDHAKVSFKQKKNNWFKTTKGIIILLAAIVTIVTFILLFLCK